MIFAFHGNSGDGGVMVTTWDKHTEQGMVLIAPSALPTGPRCMPSWRTIDRDFPDWSDFTAVDPCPPMAPRGHDLAPIDAISQVYDATRFGSDTICTAGRLSIPIMGGNSIGPKIAVGNREAGAERQINFQIGSRPAYRRLFELERPRRADFLAELRVAGFGHRLELRKKAHARGYLAR